MSASSQLEEEFCFAEVTRDDIAEVTKFNSLHFLPREPVALSLDYLEGSHDTWLQSAVETWVQDGVSLLARHKLSGDLAANMLCNLIHRDSGPNYNFQVENPKAKAYMEFVWYFEAQFDVKDCVKAQIGIDMAMLSVAPKYARRGLGSLIVQKSLDLAASKGCQWAQTTASGIYSQRIFEQLGFECHYELPYSNYSNNGVTLDMEAMGPHASAKLVVKRL